MPSPAYIFSLCPALFPKTESVTDGVKELGFEPQEGLRVHATGLGIFKLADLHRDLWDFGM